MRLWLIRLLCRSFKHEPLTIYSDDNGYYEAWLVPRVLGRDYLEGEAP